MSPQKSVLQETKLKMCKRDSLNVLTLMFIRILIVEFLWKIVLHLHEYRGNMIHTYYII